MEQFRINNLDISSFLVLAHAIKNTSVLEWIKKMWYLYTMEFYAAMKKNEILLFTSKCMDQENIILSEVSQAQKTKNPIFSFICGL
jgi:hypothetical protein